MTETLPSTTPRPASSDATPADPAAATGGKKPIRWTMVAMWLAIIGVLALLGWGLINANATRPEAGAQAPDFDIEFFEGHEWEGREVAHLSDMRGKVVVLNFWASWCVECRYEAEALEQAWQKYGGDDVVFLGVAYADVEPNSLAYMDEWNVTYPHAPDLGTDISQAYEITGVPETFFIGKDGTIAHVQIGPVSQERLEGLIEQLLVQ